MTSLNYKLFALSENDNLLSTEARVEAFRFVVEKPPPISKYLEENHSPENGTIHAFLLSVYQSAGWSPPTTRKVVEEVDSLEPVLKIPSIEFCLFYTVIGISTDLLDRFFRTCCPDFSTVLLLLELCRDSGESIENCFPSLRFEISNREKQIERSIQRRIGPPQAEKRKRTREERQRENREKRQKKKESLDRKFGRIIPIFSLPLVLSRLPDFYQEVNITLTQCELLERMVWSWLEVRRDKYVLEQLNLMKHNRRFLHFQQQSTHQSFYVGDVREYTLKMKEAELLFIKLYEMEKREKEKKIKKHKRLKK